MRFVVCASLFAFSWPLLAEDAASSAGVVDERPAATTDVPATATDPPVVADERATAPDGSPAPAATDQPPPAVDDAAAASAIESPSVVVGADGAALGDATDAPPPAPPADVSAPAIPTGVSFSGIPAVNYISDNGLGLGIIAAAYINDGVTLPYRTAITLQLFMSTNLVQDHNVIVDTLKLFDLPLRLTGRVGYISSLTQNYCGLGGKVTCDPVEAAAAADARGLTGDKADEFARHYYQRRFMNPYGLVNLRYALVEKSALNPKVEVTGGYRGFYFIPGNVFADDDEDGAPDLEPYPGSLYAKDFPDGEPGYDSVFNLGLMIDSRDNEPAPTEGWWLEGSVRAASPLWLSTWTWGGVNLTMRGYRYLPLFPELGRRLVLANRLTFDGIVGDIPIQEMARLGGSQDIYAFGGADIGRGIRVQRYLGKVKLLDQVELRYRFFEFEAFEQDFALTTAAFVDAGLVGDELISPTSVGSAVGGGLAFRIAWNENFIIRVDVAVSPAENYAIQPYITINQPF